MPKLKVYHYADTIILAEDKENAKSLFERIIAPDPNDEFGGKLIDDFYKDVEEYDIHEVQDNWTLKKNDPQCTYCDNKAETMIDTGPEEDGRVMVCRDHIDPSNTTCQGCSGCLECEPYGRNM